MSNDNTRFREYVTTQAFALTLSRKMCEALEALSNADEAKTGFVVFYQYANMQTINALVERGLIWHDVDKKTGRGPWRITKAGELLYPLLVHCGLCADVNAKLAA